MSKKQNNKSEELLSLDELIAEAEEGDVDNSDDENNEDSTPELEKLIEERDSLKDKLMRSLADSENLRKRSIRDRSDACLLYTSPSPRD